jgi:hypothetical protein
MPGRGAAAVILDESGRLLLIKANYERRRWGFQAAASNPGSRRSKREGLTRIY